MVRVYRDSWPWYVSICYCGPRQRGFEGISPSMRSHMDKNLENAMETGSDGALSRSMSYIPTCLGYLK